MYVSTVVFSAATSRCSRERLTLAASLYRPRPSPLSFSPAVGTTTLAAPAPPPEPKTWKWPALIVGHGASSHRGRHAEFCRVACAHGFLVLALDFRGHGDSEGTADGELDLDLVAAARFLRAQGEIDPHRIYYRGSSMGGFYGIRAATAAGFAGLVLLCPASRRVLLDVVRKAEQEQESGRPSAADSPPARWDLASMRCYLEKQEEWEGVSQVICPVLVVHARGDEVVPLEQSLELARHLPGEVTLKLLPGGSHTSAQHDPDVHHLTVHWLTGLARPKQ